MHAKFYLFQVAEQQRMSYGIESNICCMIHRYVRRGLHSRRRKEAPWRELKTVEVEVMPQPARISDIDIIENVKYFTNVVYDEDAWHSLNNTLVL